MGERAGIFRNLLDYCEPSVLFYNVSGFIISVYNLTLWFAIKDIFS